MICFLRLVITPFSHASPVPAWKRPNVAIVAACGITSVVPTLSVAWEICAKCTRVYLSYCYPPPSISPATRSHAPAIEKQKTNKYVLDYRYTLRRYYLATGNHVGSKGVVTRVIYVISR